MKKTRRIHAPAFKAEALLPLLSGPDAAARDRTFAALLEMGKLDLAELWRAHEGG